MNDKYIKILKPLTSIALKKNTFKNKNVLITGGGSGLGKEIATMYSKLGANVTIVSRNVNKLEITSKEILNKSKNKVNFYCVDVSCHEQIKNLCKKLRDTNNFPNIIINNAAGNFLCRSEKLSYRKGAFKFNNREL